jgi:hypothetical protein
MFDIYDQRAYSLAGVAMKHRLLMAKVTEDSAVASSEYGRFVFLLER